MFRFTLILVLTLEVAGLALLAALVPGAPVLLLAAVPVVTMLAALGAHRLTRTNAYRVRRLSPEVITGSRPRVPGDLTPEELSRTIVERAGEIQRTLEGHPSEVRIEMCALGYRTCVNDMITLSHLTREALSTANPLRRIRLNRARRRATEALAAVREALPPGAIRTTHQEL
jgi:hypothetical protein